MDMERQDLIKKRNRVRETMRTVAELMGLDLYFAQRQRFNEIKAVFVDTPSTSYYHIVVKLDEMENPNVLFDDLRHYFEITAGKYFNGCLTIERTDTVKEICDYVSENESVLTSARKKYLTADDLESKLKTYAKNKEHENAQFFKQYFSIKQVIFNDPATIVIWADGTKTVVKCQDGDVFDKEKGLAMAISKRALGDKGNYCEVFKKWIPEIEAETNKYTDLRIPDSVIDLAKSIKQATDAFKKLGEIFKPVESPCIGCDVGWGNASGETCYDVCEKYKEYLSKKETRNE